MIYLLFLILLLNQTARAVELQGNVSSSNQVKPLEVGAKYELGALGIEHDYTGWITYVDPGSYLYGTIKPGDVLVFVNGQPASKALRKKENYGEDKSEIILGIIKYPDSLYYLSIRKLPEGQKKVHVHYYLCHRASLNNLTDKDLAQGLMQEYK